MLWLQQQLVKNRIPLVKVAGTQNCLDLLTKHLASVIQQTFVAYMRLELQEGRAMKAAQLQTLERPEPWGEFWDVGEADRWGERGEQGQWVRVHHISRVAKFTPFRFLRGPGRKTRRHQ